MYILPQTDQAIKFQKLILTKKSQLAASSIFQYWACTSYEQVETNLFN